MTTTEKFAFEGEDLDRGIERVLARELSEMVDYQSLQADVLATRDSIISSAYAASFHNAYALSRDAQSQFFAEGAD